VFFCKIKFLQIKHVVCNTRISLSCSHCRSLSRWLARSLTLWLDLLLSCSPDLFTPTRLRCRSCALVLSLPHSHSASFSLPPISPTLLLALSRALLLALYLARSLSLFFHSSFALSLLYSFYRILSHSRSLAPSVCLSLAHSISPALLLILFRELSFACARSLPMKTFSFGRITRSKRVQKETAV